MELGIPVDLPLHHRPAFVLTLQDVLLQPDDPSQCEADNFESDLMKRFDGLVVSSEEDQRLLGNISSQLVINGVDLEFANAYEPSYGKHSILIIGPFRASINLEGIVAFLHEVYPIVQSKIPDVSLTIVGGLGARGVTAHLSCFQHPSITVIEQIDDIIREIRAHALTINPQTTLRGSSLDVFPCASPALSLRLSASRILSCTAKHAGNPMSLTQIGMSMR